jgi:hypothetical protein
MLARGKGLVQTSGCLNCHNLVLDNQSRSVPLSQMPLAVWHSGCLSDSTDADSKAPEFGLTPAEVQALRHFGATDRSSLARHIPREFAERNVKNLKCAGCHGKVEGVPALDIVGQKLRPEWSEAFIGGEIADKPRPWLQARMPAFRPYAPGLARGFAMVHGYPPKTPPEPAVDPAAVAAGRKLVSADGGLSCISCHAVGKATATQVFENPGVNLAYAHERLLKPYFVRWVRNPLVIDPVTKMPMFFDEQLRGVLVDIYDGDGAKQIDAIWQYLQFTAGR